MILYPILLIVVLLGQSEIENISEDCSMKHPGLMLYFLLLTVSYMYIIIGLIIICFKIKEWKQDYNNYIRERRLSEQPAMVIV